MSCDTDIDFDRAAMQDNTETVDYGTEGGKSTCGIGIEIDHAAMQDDT